MFLSKTRKQWEVLKIDLVSLGTPPNVEASAPENADLLWAEFILLRIPRVVFHWILMMPPKNWERPKLSTSSLIISCQFVSSCQSSHKSPEVPSKNSTGSLVCIYPSHCWADWECCLYIWHSLLEKERRHKPCKRFQTSLYQNSLLLAFGSGFWCWRRYWDKDVKVPLWGD